MDKVTGIFRKVLLIYWAILTYLLLKPAGESESLFLIPYFDKVVHFGVFSGLGFLLAGAFPKLKFLSFFQIMLCFAFFTEIFQDEMQLGRAMEAFDVLADAVGSLIGYLVYEIFSMRVMKKK